MEPDKNIRDLSEGGYNSHIDIVLDEDMLCVYVLNPTSGELIWVL
jgi:hypothetical protein